MSKVRYDFAGNLSEVNELAANGWRVVHCLADDAFLMELAETGAAPKPAASEAWGALQSAIAEARKVLTAYGKPNTAALLQNALDNYEATL